VELLSSPLAFKGKQTMSLPPGFSRRNFLRLSPFAFAGALLAACAPAATAPPTSTPEAPVANAEEALQRLLAGNQRYVAHQSTDVNESESRRVELAQGQKPFATIFSCVDSRVPPELIFDRGLGDLFVIRTAGQVIDNAVLGSLEYGVAELHIPLLMVLGHEKCGAVKATIETLESHTTAAAEINWLVEGIRPAVEKVKDQDGDVLDNAVKANVELIVQRLKATPILSEAVATGELKIVGGRYDLDSGVVEVL
jgi:carbonic anhydrase